MSNRTKVVGEQVITTPEVHSKLVDISVSTSTVIYAGPALLRGVNISTALNNFAVTFANRGNTETIPAGSLTGWLPFGDVYFPDGITAAYDASATGIMNVKYIPLG